MVAPLLLKHNRIALGQRVRLPGVIIMKVVIEVSGMCEMGPEEGFQKEGREGGVDNKEGEEVLFVSFNTSQFTCTSQNPNQTPPPPQIVIY